MRLINPTSIEENAEYGGFIVRRDDGKFSFTDPVTQGEPDTVDLGPTPRNAVGQYHTHSAPSPGAEVLSGPDRAHAIQRAIQAFEKFGQQTWSTYLATPGGKFIVGDVERRRGGSVYVHPAVPLGP